MNKERGKPPTGKSIRRSPEKPPKPTADFPEAPPSPIVTDETHKVVKVTKDYTKAKPEEIAADIERTRAHMDETLASLGRKIHRPGLARKITMLTFGSLAAGALAYFGFRALRPRKTKSLASRWHEARVFEQVNLARKMAMAARKGKPTIIVVQPRKV